LADQPSERSTRRIAQHQDAAAAVLGSAGRPVATCPCAAATGRRALLGAGLGILAAKSAAAQTDPARDRPRAGDLLVKLDDAKRAPLTPDDIALDASQLMTWPMDPADNVVRDGSRLNKVLLVRLDPGVLQPQTRERAADGVVAYSAICPHTACEVTNWYADRMILECPCHNSQYDPKAGAQVISGPSPRNLAALPLRIADGKLMVARPFIGRLGIQQI
jgi:rieske iron-sulfur protein